MYNASIQYLKSIVTLVFLFSLLVSPLQACVQKSTGAFCLNHSEFNTEDQGLASLLQRIYYSLDEREGLLGQKWNLALEKELKSIDDYILFFDPLSQEKNYYFVNPTFKTLSGIPKNTILTDLSNQYTLQKYRDRTFKVKPILEEESYLFNEMGQLIQYQSEFGIYDLIYEDNRNIQILKAIEKNKKVLVSFVYDSHNLLKEIRNAKESVTFSYLNDQLEKVRDDILLKYRYEYHTSQVLGSDEQQVTMKVTNYPDKTRNEYTFDSRNRILRIHKYFYVYDHNNYQEGELIEYDYFATPYYQETEVATIDELRYYRYYFKQLQPFAILDSVVILDENQMYLGFVHYEQGRLKEVFASDFRLRAQYNQYEQPIYMRNAHTEFSMEYYPQHHKIKTITKVPMDQLDPYSSKEGGNLYLQKKRSRRYNRSFRLKRESSRYLLSKGYHKKNCF
jgi:hypothetical protein